MKITKATLVLSVNSFDKVFLEIEGLPDPLPNTAPNAGVVACLDVENGEEWLKSIYSSIPYNIIKID